MGIKLEKGGSINLSKEHDGLEEVEIGLGWDAKAHVTAAAPEKKKGFLKKLLGAVEDAVAPGGEVDLDLFAFLMEGSNVSNTISFTNLSDNANGIQHYGDDLTGRSAGHGEDNEIIHVNLSKVKPQINKLDFWANIYACQSRHQTFGNVRGAFIRIVNKANGEELAKFNLSDDTGYTDKTAMHFGSLIRDGAGWKFQADGLGSRATSIGEAKNSY